MTPVLIAVSAALSVASVVMWVQLRKARRAEYIRSFTLPHGLFERLQKHHPQLTQKDCQLVSKGLRQFFLAYLQSGQRYVSMPSQAADDLWHEFILYTKNYQQFCRKAFGGFLHHTPAVVLRSSAQSNAGLRRCWLHSCRDELINPRNATRLPLLFALDGKLNIAGGFRYEANCKTANHKMESDRGAGLIYCGGDFSDTSIDGGTDGFDSFASADSSDGCGGDSGCGGGCGGGD
jgi:hypothetical protein